MTGTKALTLITGGGDIARDSARSEEAGVDRGEDSGGEHGHRTRRVAGARAQSGAPRGSVAAARALGAA